MSATRDRRTYAREYARKRRAAKLAAKMAHAERCPFTIGAFVCGARLRVDVDRMTGRTVVICDRCARRRAGICLDCPRPVAGMRGRALRCAEHTHAAKLAASEASKARHADTVAAAQRAYHTRPEIRAQKAEYKKLWRKANPEKVKAYKRREALRQNPKALRYHRRYNERHREHYRELARERYYKLHPTRPAPVCVACGVAIPFTPPGRPAKRCDACVPASVRKRREAVRARRAAEAASDPAFGVPAKPRKVRRPAAPAVKLVTGDRLCLGEGCHTVVVGRAKKCEPCKAHERVVAVAVKRAQHPSRRAA